MPAADRNWAVGPPRPGPPESIADGTGPVTSQGAAGSAGDVPGRDMVLPGVAGWAVASLKV